MATSTTQADRHWIRVNIDDADGYARALFLDLNMVDDVVVVWDPDNLDRVSKLAITSKARLKPLGLDGDNARFFYEKWTEFIELRAEQKTVGPGLIHKVSGNNGLKLV